jgi:hypothetical protein
MGKKINRDRERILSKADIKANNILKAVKTYEAEDSDLSIRRAAALFHYSLTVVEQPAHDTKTTPKASLVVIAVCNLRD